MWQKQDVFFFFSLAMLSHLGIRSRSTRKRQMACHLWLPSTCQVVQPGCFSPLDAGDLAGGLPSFRPEWFGGLSWRLLGCHAQNGKGHDFGFGAILSTQPFFLSVRKWLLVVFPCFGWKATGERKRFTCRGFLLQLCTFANRGDVWLGLAQLEDPSGEIPKQRQKISENK